MVIYNLSIEKHCFPRWLKVARVLTGYKSGPKDIDNYRPISNRPAFSKIFEMLTLSRMLPFIDKHSLLSNSQFGFRKEKKNITHAAIKLTTAIINAYHLRYFSACFFLDLR